MGDCTKESENCSGQALESSVAVVAVESSLVFLIMVASIACNILVGFAILRRPDTRSWSSNKLLLNLTFANLVLSVSVMPFVFHSSLQRRWQFGLTWCEATGFITNLLRTTSVWTAMFLSIDLYHCIVNSLNYPMIMSPSKTYFFIGLSWALSLFIAILPIAGWGQYGFNMSVSSCMVVVRDNSRGDGYIKFYFVVVFIVPLLVIFWKYYHILKAARRQARVAQIAVLPQSVRGSISSTASVFIGSKALRTTFIVLGPLLFLWGPYNMVMLLKIHKVSISRWVEVTAVLLSFSSTVIYPGIYGFRVRAIRKEIKRLVWRRLCGDENAVRPLSASEAAFLSQSPFFRNRSVSDGCLDFNVARRNTGAFGGQPSCGLPVISEEDEAGSSNIKTKPTDQTDLEFSTEALPGAVNV